MRAHRAEIDAIAASARGADLRQHGRRLRPQRTRCSARIERLFVNLTRPRLRPRCRRSSARWRRSSRRITARSTCTRSCSPASTRCTRSAPSSASRRRSCGSLERVHLDFVRAGARLTAAAQGALRARSCERLAELTTRFSQNVLADEASSGSRCATSATSRACPSGCARRAREAAQRARRGRRRVITLSRSLVVPFLTFSSRRDLREQAFKAWIAPRRARRRARQPAGRARDPGAAQRAGAAARLRELRRLRAGGPHGRHARRGGARCWSRCGSRPRPGPATERDALAAMARAQGADARRSSRGTGATTPRRCARRDTASTTRS